MPKFHLPIIDNQMLADVFVFKGEENNPPHAIIKALFDTGATRSCITSQLAKQLTLIPQSKIQILAAHGKPKDCNVYKLKVGFPFPAPNNGLRVEIPSEIEVAEIDDNPVWKMIVGMDIIQQGVLVVDSGNYIFSI